jgi:hypothetical protein
MATLSEQKNTRSKSYEALLHWRTSSGEGTPLCRSMRKKKSACLNPSPNNNCKPLSPSSCLAGGGSGWGFIPAETSASHPPQKHQSLAVRPLPHTKNYWIGEASSAEGKPVRRSMAKKEGVWLNSPANNKRKPLSPSPCLAGGGSGRGFIPAGTLGSHPPQKLQSLAVRSSARSKNSSSKQQLFQGETQDFFKLL